MCCVDQTLWTEFVFVGFEFIAPKYSTPEDMHINTN